MRTTTTDQQRLQVCQALHYLQRRWQQGSLIILAFLLCFGVPARAEDLPQDITLSFRDATLDKVFKEIRKQTGYSFVYTESELSRASKVTIQVSNSSLDRVLSLCFQNQPLTYTIVDKIVVVKPRQESRTAVPVVNTVAVADPKKISMRGRVLSEKGDPLAGATITVRRSDMSTTTDEDGYFALTEIEEDAVLLVSSVGHVTQQVKLSAGKLNMEIKLPIAIKDEEEVVVAYNKISQRSNTGAVTVVKGEQIQTLPNRSFDKSLQGLVPGLLVTSGNGQPGAPPANFVLRGIATGGQPVNGETFRNPLIVVDGVPVSQEPPGYSTYTNRITNPLAQLNPSDIETISILKDASAVALYGSQASNGVLLVTTKKGKAGKTVFNFRHQTDITSALEGKIEMLNQEEYLELLFESYKNTNPAYTDAAILADLRRKFPVIVNSPGDTSFYPQADWRNALLNNNSVTMANEISMSGGNEKSNFYLNFEYTKQNGIAKNTGYDRKSMRFNYEHRPTSWLKIGLNTTLSYNIQDYSNSGFSSFLRITAISPLNPIRDINDGYFYTYYYGLGSGGGIQLTNPVAQSELDINNSTAYRGLSRLSADIKITPNISFSSSVGTDFMLNEAKEKNHPLVSTSKGFIQEQLFRTTGIINTNLLQFDKQWNNTHSLNILAGQESRIQTSKYTFVSRNDLSGNPDQDQLNSGNTISSATGNNFKQNLLSYFGQVSYGFRSKYYLSGSIRSDGSSRFGKNNRFGTYWSAGMGWVVSEESFMQTTRGWLSFFKLRGSMGPAGNSAAITDQLRFDRLSLVNFLNGTTVFPALGNPGNPSIQWEETFTWDGGLELRLLKDRISFTADVYTRKTKNLIAYDINAPLGTGYAQLTGNVGDVKNQGIELSLSATIVQEKNFSWNLSANWSRNRNKLTKSFLPETAIVGTNLVNKVGYEYNSFYLKEWAGVNPENGRPMWVDSTGKSTENWDAAKPSIVGKAQPDGFGGISNILSYKGIGLSFMFYYQYGSQVYAEPKLQNDGNANGMDPYLNQTKAALDRWQKPGDIANNPRRLLNGQAITNTGTITDRGTYVSTRYLFSGDFIRLSNVGLSYSLPKSWIERLRMTTAKIYVQAHNLATWTKYSGQDPENVGPSGNGSVLYPQAKSYSIGLNVSF